MDEGVYVTDMIFYHSTHSCLALSRLCFAPPSYPRHEHHFLIQAYVSSWDAVIEESVASFILLPLSLSYCHSNRARQLDFGLLAIGRLLVVFRTSTSQSLTLKANVASSTSTNHPIRSVALVHQADLLLFVVLKLGSRLHPGELRISWQCNAHASERVQTSIWFDANLISLHFVTRCGGGRWFSSRTDGPMIHGRYTIRCWPDLWGRSVVPAGCSEHGNETYHFLRLPWSLRYVCQDTGALEFLWKPWLRARQSSSVTYLQFPRKQEIWLKENFRYWASSSPNIKHPPLGTFDIPHFSLGEPGYKIYRKQPAAYQ